MKVKGLSLWKGGCVKIDPGVENYLHLNNLEDIKMWIFEVSELNI